MLCEKYQLYQGTTTTTGGRPQFTMDTAAILHGPAALPHNNTQYSLGADQIQSVQLWNKILVLFYW